MVKSSPTPRRESKVDQKKLAYQAPRVVAIGKAVALVQGPPGGSRYDGSRRCRH